MGHMAVLTMAKGYVFKWTPNPPLEILANLHLERPRKQKNRIRKILKVASTSLRFLKM